MSLVPFSADKRFRRAHVKPARLRRHWWSPGGRALRLVAVALVLGYAAYRGAITVAQAHVLQVDRIVVAGNERLSTGEVLAMLGGLRGQSLLWTDLDTWRDRLLSSPWVRSADLRRSLPSTIEVFVSERQPIGIGRVGTHLYLVDERGTVIDEYGPQYAEFDLPIIDGLPEADESGATDAPRVELAARLLASVRSNPEIARRLSQIDVRDLHNATVILAGDPVVLQLGEEQFLGRLQSYQDLAPTLHNRVAEIDSVDLRFDGRVYVRPTAKAGKGNVPAAAKR